MTNAVKCEAGNMNIEQMITFIAGTRSSILRGRMEIDEIGEFDRGQLSILIDLAREFATKIETQDRNGFFMAVGFTGLMKG